MLVPLLLALLFDEGDEEAKLAKLRELRGRTGIAGHRRRGPRSPIGEAIFALREQYEPRIIGYLFYHLGHGIFGFDTFAERFSEATDAVGHDENFFDEFYLAEPERMRRFLIEAFRGDRPGLVPYVPWIAQNIDASGDGVLFPTCDLEEGELPRLLDWLDTEQPDITGIDGQRALELSEEWHDNMGHGRFFGQPVEDAVIIYRWPDGGSLQLLVTDAHFRAEGESMGHCIGGKISPKTGRASGRSHFFVASNQGRQRSYSYRDPTGTPRASFTLSTPLLGNTTLHQIHGPKNRAILDDVAAARILWSVENLFGDWTVDSSEDVQAAVGVYEHISEEFDNNQNAISACVDDARDAMALTKTPGHEDRGWSSLRYEMNLLFETVDAMLRFVTDEAGEAIIEAEVDEPLEEGLLEIPGMPIDPVPVMRRYGISLARNEDDAEGFDGTIAFFFDPRIDEKPRWSLVDDDDVLAMETDTLGEILEHFGIYFLTDRRLKQLDGLLEDGGDPTRVRTWDGKTMLEGS